MAENNDTEIPPNYTHLGQQLQTPADESLLVSCNCKSCSNVPKRRTCMRTIRAMRHTEKVTILLSRCQEASTILIGPTETVFTCQKLLLAYFSNFFDSILFNSHEETNNDLLRLPEERSDHFQFFISWIYTGRLDWNGCTSSRVPAESLWLLGHRLKVPAFMNEAMYFVFAECQKYPSPSVEETDLVFKFTTPSSTLRTYTKALLAANGPLHRSMECNLTHRAEWVIFLAKGGDVIRECIELSFDRISLHKPYSGGNWHKYLERYDHGRDPRTWRRLEVNYLNGRRLRGLLPADEDPEVEHVHMHRDKRRRLNGQVTETVTETE